MIIRLQQRITMIHRLTNWNERTHKRSISFFMAITHLLLFKSIIKNIWYQLIREEWNAKKSKSKCESITRPRKNNLKWLRRRGFSITSISMAFLASNRLREYCLRTTVAIQCLLFTKVKKTSEGVLIAQPCLIQNSKLLESRVRYRH